MSLVIREKHIDPQWIARIEGLPTEKLLQELRDVVSEAYAGEHELCCAVWRMRFVMDAVRIRRPGIRLPDLPQILAHANEPIDCDELRTSLHVVANWRRLQFVPADELEQELEATAAEIQNTRDQPRPVPAAPPADTKCVSDLDRAEWHCSEAEKELCRHPIYLRPNDSGYEMLGLTNFVSTNTVAEMLLEAWHILLGVHPRGQIEIPKWLDAKKCAAFKGGRTHMGEIADLVEFFGQMRGWIGRARETEYWKSQSVEIKNIVDSAVTEAVVAIEAKKDAPWPPPEGWGFTSAAVSLNGKCATIRPLASNALKLLARLSLKNRATTYQDFRREVWSESDATEKTIQNTLTEVRVALRRLRELMGLPLMKDPVPNLGDNAGWKLPEDMRTSISRDFS